MVERGNGQESPLQSFEAFKTEGLQELLAEISPIQDLSFELHLIDHNFEQPRLSEEECRQKEDSYIALLRLYTELRLKETREVKAQIVILGDFPLMTQRGTFIVNGVERLPVISTSEVFEKHLRKGLRLMAQETRSRMSLVTDPDIATPSALISNGPFADAIQRSLQEITSLS